MTCFRQHPPKKVLFINTFGIGDVLFTTPMISNLKERFPDVYIGYLCNRRTAALLERNPKINRILVYERDELAALRARSSWQYVRAIKLLIKDINSGRFDTVLDVSLNNFMGFLTWAAGIPRRVGFDYKGRGFFLTQKNPLEGYEDKHVVEYYLDLLQGMGVPVPNKALELPLSAEDTAWAGRFLEENHISGRPPVPQSGTQSGTCLAGGPVIGLVPGGGESWGKDASCKRWSAERFAKLADKLIEKFTAQIILLGGSTEAGLCDSVARGMKNPCVSACGKTSLSQFAALTQRCALIVTNDGGPLHVAVAAGSKTASIFGPVDEIVYGPYPSGIHKVIKKDLACQPCYRSFRRADCAHIRCLNELTVEEVFGKVEEIL